MCFPQTLYFFVFVFLVPILFFIDKTKLVLIENKGINKHLLKMFMFSFLFSMISSFWFLSVYPLDWLKIEGVYSLFIILFVWILFGLCMSLPVTFWLYLVFKLRTNNFFLNALTGASSWIVLEYVRSWFVAISVYGNQTLFGPHNTYYSLAYTVANMPIFKELLPFGGIYLASFVIILVNYLLYYIFFTKPKDNNRKEFYLLLIFVLAIIFISFFTLKNLRNKGESQIFQATIINADFPASVSKEVDKQKTDFSLNVVKESKNKVVILPENFNVLRATSSKDLNFLNEKNLIIGSFSGKEFYNMYFLNPQTKNIEYYRKQLLMPLGEYRISFVNFIAKTILNKNLADNYSTKKSNTSFLFKDSYIKNLIIGSSICSENISPYIYRDEARRGATVFVNVRSHAHFHGSLLLARQTLAIDTTRALENGRYFVVSGNQAWSYVISDDGVVKNLIKPRGNNSIDSDVGIKNYITPYVKYGDYMVYISFLFLVFIFSETFNNKTKSK